MSEPPNEQVTEQPKSGAASVASGIFASRILGLLRERAAGYFFGVGAFADVWQTAFKTPNLLQNLLGEGTISAAFIPIYCRLLDEDRPEEAGRFAGAIFGLLLTVAAIVSLLGVLLAPYIVALLAPGFVADARGDLPLIIQSVADFLGGVGDWLGNWELFEGLAAGSADPNDVNRYALTVQAVRILFPMTGVLVLAAWTLGVLNSHRRFFLPYVAPVLWNIAIIGGLFGAAYLLLPDPLGVETRLEISDSTLAQLLFAAFWGALAGGLLQFLVQLPLVARVITGFEFSLSRSVTGVREAIRAFGPVVAGRGVYQLSAYLDLFLGSLIAAGALSALRWAQTLYVLPISLFGMSVAAAELPELSRISESQLENFMSRIRRSLRQMLFLIVPTVVGYLVFGFLIVGALYRTGSFGLNDNWLVYFVLAGYAPGLFATAASRLLQNAFYALNDTKTPARIAVVRVLVSAVVAIPLMFWLDQFEIGGVVGFDPASQPLFLGAIGLAVGASAGAWVELWRLYRELKARTGAFDMPWRELGIMMLAVLGALLPGTLVWWLLPDWHVALQALVVVTVFAATYLGLSSMLGLPEMKAWTRQVTRRFKS